MYVLLVTDNTVIIRRDDKEKRQKVSCRYWRETAAKEKSLPGHILTRIIYLTHLNLHSFEN